jgi:CO/xanthine dehydrogenase FAD-binding subunit
MTEAALMLGQLGEGAKLLAGGQSLIPLLKLRFASPEHLVDLNFIAGTSFIRERGGSLWFGAMTRHAEIENSPLAREIPIARPELQMCKYEIAGRLADRWRRLTRAATGATLC